MVFTFTYSYIRIHSVFHTAQKYNEESCPIPLLWENSIGLLQY